MRLWLRSVLRGSRVRPRELALSCAIALVVWGCGHPASQSDCELIFDKSAEVELRAQNVTDPELVAERVAAVREARGPALIDKCVGRRITDAALACVRSAESTNDIERCLQ